MLTLGLGRRGLTLLTFSFDQAWPTPHLGALAQTPAPLQTMSENSTLSLHPSLMHLHSFHHPRFNLSVLALAVELVLATLSASMGLFIFLPSILRSHERTLRFQLIIGLSCSDFFLA